MLCSIKVRSWLPGRRWNTPGIARHGLIKVWTGQIEIIDRDHLQRQIQLLALPPAIGQGRLPQPSRTIGPIEIDRPAAAAFRQAQKRPSKAPDQSALVPTGHRSDACDDARRRHRSSHASRSAPPMLEKCSKIGGFEQTILIRISFEGIQDDGVDESTLTLSTICHCIDRGV